MKVQLVCTFAKPRYVESCINEIVERHKIIFEKIFIFKSEDIDDNIISYNIDKTLQEDFLTNTVLVHRNRYTNTLYTINALNEIIRSANNGVLDKNYTVSWENYKNELLVTNPNNELNRIGLILKNKTRIITK